MPEATTVDTVTVVVMAKSAVPGRVKSRLIGALSARQAARVHGAMLQCVLDRAGSLIGKKQPIQRFLALDDAGEGTPIDFQVPDGWITMDQGTGDLGQRMDRVWQRCPTGPVVFLGADSPDVPGQVLGSIVTALTTCPAAVGPTHDGGYWTLAAGGYLPGLLKAIDWGSDRVYHQTQQAAGKQGVAIRALAAWFDIDTALDLQTLRQRLTNGQNDPALEQLRGELDRICGNLPHEQRR